MKIACFLIDKYQKIIFRSSFENIIILNEPLSTKNMNLFLDADIIVSRARGIKLKFDEKILKKFHNLKLICSMSSGFDHIDLKYCKKNNISVSNVPSYAESSVAEYTFALILSISRKILTSLKPINSKFNYNNLTGFELDGKTLGIIGSGKIGLKVIKIARGFNMKVIAYDIYHNENARKNLDFEYLQLDDVIRNSDIISLHIPYNEKTFHLLNKDNLSLLKKGAIIINNSRGELIDSESLYQALKSGRISFAGLDVLEKNSKFNKKIMNMKNVFISPHNASNTIEAKNKVLEETIKNIYAFMNGDGRNLL